MLQQFHDLLLRQFFQHKHTASGKKRRIDLKRRILRGSPDQKNASLFHKRKERILLCFVEAMDLVHKHNGAHSHLSAVLRLFHHLTDLPDPAGDGAEIDKLRSRSPGNDPCQCRLAHPRRSPENHGRNLISLDELAKHPALAEQMLLAHKFIQ